MGNLQFTLLAYFVTKIHRTTGDNIHAQGLQSTNIFRDARSEAELEIYKRLNAKVDEFLELASYDWTLDESKGHASGYIQDVISFLEGSFKAFKHLPVRRKKLFAVTYPTQPKIVIV